MENYLMIGALIGALLFAIFVVYVIFFGGKD